jgi:hypothetical protein
MWLCVLHPDMRGGYYRDGEQIIREGIADLRAAWAAHFEDVGLAELVEELRAASDEFVRLWEQHDVRVNRRGIKQLLHPRVGQLSVLRGVGPAAGPGPTVGDLRRRRPGVADRPAGALRTRPSGCASLTAALNKAVRGNCSV